MMDTLHKGSPPLPANVLLAIRRLIDDAKDSDLPMVDVNESAAKLAAAMPEAATLGLARLRDEIAHAASLDGHVGLSIDRVA
jgi:hypothetical protein